jgi:hypothetical protein
VFSQDQYQKVDGGKKEMIKLTPNVYCAGIFSLKTTKANNGLDAKNVCSGLTLFVQTIGKGPLYETGVRNDRHLFRVGAKCYKNFVM